MTMTFIGSGVFPLFIKDVSIDEVLDISLCIDCYKHNKNIII